MAEQVANPNDAPDMSIVMVCWNNKDYLDPCLKSLYEGGLRSTFDIAATDNGSTDGSQEMLRQKYPDVKIIQNDHNVGLGKASNQGIQATNGRYVLLFNNDTLVDGPSLDALVDFMDKTPDAGAVGGTLLNEDGSFQSAYGNFSTLWEEFMIATHLGERLHPGYPLHGQSDKVEEVGWLSSACLLVRRAALDQVGLLDESYFIYGDEVDLQYRMQQAGWKVYFIPNSSTIHYGGRSMNRWKRRRMVYRGKMLFYKKHYGPLKTGLLRLMFAALSAIKLIPWLIAWLLPSMRKRARLELASNLDVIKLCWKLE